MLLPGYDKPNSNRWTIASKCLFICVCGIRGARRCKEAEELGFAEINKNITRCNDELGR